VKARQVSDVMLPCEVEDKIAFANVVSSGASKMAIMSYRPVTN
jgi:hypothetical protein